MLENSPEVRVDSDYDGYFEALVRRWIKEKSTPFKSKTIVITAGPYRSSAVTTQRRGDELHIDFYSAVRNGFGGFSAADVSAIKEEWL